MKMNKIERVDKMKHSIIKDFRDYEILKANLTDAELNFANECCELHESYELDENGNFTCGCCSDAEDYGSHCEAGCWIEGCIGSNDFIDYAKEMCVQ